MAYTIGNKTGVPTLGGLNSNTPVAEAEDIAMQDGTSVEDTIRNILSAVAQNSTSIDEALTSIKNAVNDKLSDVLINGTSVKQGNTINLNLSTVNGVSLLSGENIEIANDMTSEVSSVAPDVYNDTGAKLYHPNGAQILPITSFKQVYCYPNLKLSDHMKAMYWALSQLVRGLGVIYTDAKVTYRSLTTNDIVPTLGAGYELEFVLSGVYLTDIGNGKCDIMAAKLTDNSFGATSSPFSGKTFDYLDIDNLDTSELTTLAYCFCDCTNLTKIMMRRATLLAIVDMHCFAKNCASLTEIKIAGDLSVVANLNSAFYKCTSLSSLNLSGCDLSNVTDMQYAFYKCTSLSYLDLGTGLSVSVDLSYCPLSNNSICSIFRGLKDLTGLASQSVYISTATDGTLSDDDRAIAVNKNWNIVINQLIVDPNE